MTRTLALSSNFKVFPQYWRQWSGLIARAAQRSRLFEHRTPAILLYADESYKAQIEKALHHAFKKAKLGSPIFARGIPTSGPSMTVEFEVVKGRCPCSEPWQDLEASFAFQRGLEVLPYEIDIEPAARVCRSCGEPQREPSAEADVLRDIDAL